MKQIKNNLGWSRLLSGLIILASVLILTGCETESASTKVRISPDSAVLKEKNQSVGLECLGGYECFWSLEKEQWGSLSSRYGTRVIYTSHYQPAGEEAVVQVVTVKSLYRAEESVSPPPSNNTETNTPTPTNVHYATAYITHLPAPGTATNASNLADE